VKKKQGITIALWNTRGKKDERHQNKWKMIQRIMNLHKISILAVQESRTTNEDIRKMENEHQGLKFLNNGGHSNKQGILFAINKRLVKTEKRKLEKNHKILIPDRASQLKIKWGEDQSLNLVNVYAPNRTKEKEAFYSIKS
jgi:exonuclease III